MRVIGLNHQAQFVDRDPAFWDDFRAELAKSLIAPSDFEVAPPLWEHQQRMNEACVPVLQNGGRGRIICATGGGKTRVIYQNVMDGFKMGFKVQVIVAPTIDLLRQHHTYFEKYGAFHKEDVSVIHFRTGESSEDGWADISQTTNVKDAISRFTDKTLIFVTYASEEKLFNGLGAEDVEVDLVCWDEFHHTVQQRVERRDHMLTIPSKRNLFYSASVKRGRLVCATDEEIYGPLLAEVKYSELRKTGILVPKIIVKTVFIAREKIKYLSRALKKEAKKQNFDLLTAVMEAGGTIAAYRDMRRAGKNCNAVTFSKAVAICKAITENAEVRAEFNCLLNTVHAGVPGRERKKIYEEIKTAANSVLCQFSVVKEGIDINPFNCVVFSRNMDVIGTQQAIGRAVRAHPDDTKALKAGLISIDSPEGWKKYEATLYVIMHDDSAESFKDFLLDMILKLQFAGFGEGDYEFSDISEDRHGTGDEDDSWFVPTETLKNIIDSGSVKQAVEAANIRIEELARQDEEDWQVDKLTVMNIAKRLNMLVES
jgi:superfamily II DNA or RNA helicase